MVRGKIACHSFIGAAIRQLNYLKFWRARVTCMRISPLKAHSFLFLLVIVVLSSTNTTVQNIPKKGFLMRSET